MRLSSFGFIVLSIFLASASAQESDAQVRAHEQNHYGNLVYRADLLEDASWHYKVSTSYDPNFIDPLNNRGVVLYDLGRWDEALDCLEKALDVDDQDPVVWHNLGLVLEKMGRDEVAKNAFEVADRLGLKENQIGSSPIIMEEQSEFTVLYDDQNFTAEEAGQRYKRVGDMYYEMGFLNLSLVNYEAALLVDINNAASWNDKGLIFSQRGKSQEALTCYRRATEIDPQSSIPWCNMALVLYEMGRTDEAEYCLKVAVELGEDNPALWNNMGVIMAGMCCYQEAVDCFSKSIQLDWYYSPGWNNKGVSLASLGKTEEALTCFKRAVVLKEDFSEAWYNLGLIFEELGDAELSRQAFKNAEDLGYKPVGEDYVLATEEAFMGQTNILMMAAESKGIPGFEGWWALVCMLFAIFIQSKRRDKSES